MEKRDEVEENMDLLLKKFKKFLRHNKDGDFIRSHRSSEGKGKSSKGSEDPLEHLYYSCRKLGHFKADYPYMIEEEEKSKKRERR